MKKTYIDERGWQYAVKFMRDNHTPRDSVLSILSKLS